MTDYSSTPKYLITKMTGCLEGVVPSIDVKEALTLGETIKAVNKTNGFPIYAELTAIDFGERKFTLITSEDDTIILPLDDFLFFKAEKLNSDVPRNVDSALVIGESLFTVIHNDPIPVWLGDNNLIFYADDIQQLIIKHKSYNILTNGVE